MPAAPANAATSSVALTAAVWLPSESFFVRRIALEPTAETAPQVEIALETVAPFAVTQLFHGYLRAANGGHALVFATYRRLFAEASWDGASVVAPTFLALLGDAPTTARIRRWHDGTTCVVAAWDGASDLPAVVLARTTEAATEAAVRAELLAECQRRLGVEASVEEFSGTVQLAQLKTGEWQLTPGSGGGGRQVETRLTPEACDTIDVRDKEVLVERRKQLRRDRMLWRVVQGSVVAIMLAGLLELGLIAGGVLLKQQRELQTQIAPEVARIQAAQSLGTRIEEMSRRRLRPFEMLAVLNSVRPGGIIFTRSVTTGQGGIDIEAQTANADAVGVFESALRALPMVETIEVRDLRLRDGMTTFQLAATFKVGTLSSVTGTGGAP